MSFREIAPHPALAPYVDRFWAREQRLDGPVVPIHILLDGCIDLIVDVTAGWKPVMVGAMTRSKQFVPTPGTRMFGVRFRPGGAVPFLKVTANEITDAAVDANVVGVRWLSQARWPDDGSLVAALKALESLLLSHLPVTERPHAIVAYVARALFGPSPPTIESLARDVGWSRQHLRRVVQAHVGITPVRLLRVARVQRAVDLLQRGGARLSRSAAVAGYFDQAHMHRDFQELIGVTPRTVAASRSSILPIRSLLRW
jgi:AraC-like DNA-binding protein